MLTLSPCLVLFGLPLFLALSCYAATCNDQTISGSPSKEEIAEYLTSILNLQGGTTCSDTWPPVGPLQVTVNANNMFLYRSKTSADIAMTWCTEAFSNIISQCVLQESKWGGSWELDGQSFSITNNVYPDNGIIVPDSSNPTTSQIATFQQGPFSTNYIPGITADTVTSTQLSDQPSSTVLPIWFCPGCDIAAAGILVIPLAAAAPGALIPPPPGFPPLTIGPDGAPTATGDPAPGEQPTGDPRPSSTADESNPSAMTTSVPSTTTTSISSTTTTSVSSTSSAVAACPNEKRDGSSGTANLIKREVVYIRGAIVKRAEEEATVANPLRKALDALGGTEVLLQSSKLRLVVNKLPAQVVDQKGRKVTNQVLNAYVTGLEDRAGSKLQITVNGVNKKTLEKDEFFRIRWDWDESKGVHVNAEFGSKDMYKIAFKPSEWKVSPNDPTTYERTVRQQSSRLNYNSQPAEMNTELSAGARTGKEGKQNQEQELMNMAMELAQFWKQLYGDCNNNGEPE